MPSRRRTILAVAAVALVLAALCVVAYVTGPVPLESSDAAAPPLPADVRLVRDEFDRSPGHGLAPWEPVSGNWDIEFSFDPNRIPDQYSLMGEAPPDGEALAMLECPAWEGCRLSFSVRPQEGASFGAVLDSKDAGADALRVFFSLNGQPELDVRACGRDRIAGTFEGLRPGQWHRVTIERWAWLVSVYLDGDCIAELDDLPLPAGRLGLAVRKGRAAFDDVDVEQLFWLVDDGQLRQIPWRLKPGARWYRPRRWHPRPALLGDSGTIYACLGEGKGAETHLWCEAGDGEFPPFLTTVGAPWSGVWVYNERQSLWERLFGRSPRPPYALERVAILRESPRLPQQYVTAYRFEAAEVISPSDYLDFTAEEYEEMRRSPDAARLQRRPHLVPLIGAEGLWRRESGAWQVRDGVLRGAGPVAALRHAQEVLADVDVRLRVRPLGPGSVAEVELYGGADGRGTRVRLAAAGAPAPEGTPASTALEPGRWHDVEIRAGGGRLAVTTDGKPQPDLWPIERTEGGVLRLRVSSGMVEFDDVELAVDRRDPGGCFYAFDRRETDWWREGNWVDHAGVACVAASNWISLIEPDGHGMLWLKQGQYQSGSGGHFFVVAFDVLENTEWLGWDRRPSHVHHPFDNICVVLGEKPEFDSGYRLEVNAQGRSAAVLYREGKEVARVAQDAAFPMRFVGGHAPYSPRRNRIELRKEAGNLQAIVNDRCVLTYQDPAPLDTWQVGIGGYRTRINFSRIEVRFPGPVD
jgi:hypothetical protein